MEVILTEDIPKLGNAGDVVKVKDGYARNFLLPQKKALSSDSKNLKALEFQKKMIETKQERIRKTSEEVASKLENLEITIEKEAGTQDRLFGSVTNMEIASALKKEGIQVGKHLIVLESPIKTLGTFEIKLRLHPEISTCFKLWVVRKA